MKLLKVHEEKSGDFMKNKKLIMLYCFLLFTFCFIVMTSCSSPTESSKGSLVGTVTLEGESDHLGITIALYDLAYLDTTIVRINSQYPQIGVHINQHTEFDHRLQSPVKYTETSTNGSFELTKISTGRYNILALKDGWGFKYLYEIEITKGDNEISQQLILFEERHISGNIQENITVEMDHHLIIDDDTVFVPNISSLTIEPGAVIRINPGIDLTIYGSIYAQGEEGNMFWVTSNDGFLQDLRINTNDRDEIAMYNSMELSLLCSVENDLLEWGKFDYANTCLLNQVNSLHIQNTIFKNSGCGFNSTSVDLTFCENLLAKNCDNEALGGIYYLNVDDGEISNSILNNCYNGMKIKHGFAGTVENNYFNYNFNGVELWYFIGLLEHCEFIVNSRDICFTGNYGNNLLEELEISYNQFSSIIGIWQFSAPSYPFYPSISFNYNNYYSDDWFFITLGGTVMPFNATENYFYQASSFEEIHEKILDFHDDPELPEIDVNGFLNSNVNNAGIQ